MFELSSLLAVVDKRSRLRIVCAARKGEEKNLLNEF